MSATLAEVAQQLKDADKKVRLVYAFNGTGKTRLSREFKQLIAPKDYDSEESQNFSQTKILYYNAFTEDLFYWDNDLDFDKNPILKIQPNSFTDWVLKDQGQDQNITANFQHYSNDKLNPYFNEAYEVVNSFGISTKIPAYSEVKFVYESGDDTRSENLKISKGEESVFVWSVFYTVLEQVVAVLNDLDTEDEVTEFSELEYVFIDDPVSSLDENHVIELAVNLAELIKTSPSKIKFIISTHSPLFYNVLHSHLGLSDKSKKDGCYLLERLGDGTFNLTAKYGSANSSFTYHLYLKKILEEAVIKNQIERFHFNLLRNLYEKTAGYLGYPDWTDLLVPELGDKKAYYRLIMNMTSHSRLSNEEVSEPTEPQKQSVKLLLDNLVNNYGFWKSR